MAATRAPSAKALTRSEVARRPWITRLRRRVPVAPARGDAAEAPIVLRRARHKDAAEISRLAALDGHSLPRGVTIVAESGGRLVAAADVATGAAIADPFAPTAAVVALLRLRAAQLRPLEAAL